MELKESRPEVRRRVADDFHLSVCLVLDTAHPRDVFADEWIPFINSLQPMVYYDSFFPESLIMTI